ncbi:AlkA N-terminal domain-containing protein [Demequina capsici]|uniref:DNA-3-methyladenine glycosylase II n=1 Tax=Demequina capsici TaxID=3075620 RepID=A0AA96F3A6_9MICO|nr:AlkA N-terminal domain-containing protein [Demequina sp. OYTSA14]WNM23208.1 AlkA N-terminal domain-containing protein [Demequina sp. OYTSA14]
MRDDDARYAVITGRDSRYDGQFFTGVVTTRIYCRPSCPARTPARRNVTFFRTAAAAQAAGFRSCRRCRPEAVPGSPDWDVTGDIAARAMHLIDDGVVDRDGVDGLAIRLGYSRRHLQRVLVDELGAAPLALATAHRLHSARALLEHTAMPVSDVAYAAGFGSVRQFNDAARAAWGMTPSDVRSNARRGRSARAVTGLEAGSIARTEVRLRLRVREPFDGRRALAFLAARTIAGVEETTPTVHVRTLALHHGPAIVTLEPEPGAVNATLELSDPRDLGSAVARCRALLDLDADPVAVADALGRDRAMAALVARAPGLRVPGTVDVFETIVRAVVGQQVSVAGATRTLGAIASRWGARLDGSARLLMPTPECLADVDPSSGLMPASRWRTISAVARAAVDGTLDVSPGADRSEALRFLGSIAGIGPWTRDYIMLRGYADPDAFPAGDLVLRQVTGLDAARLSAASERWSPWRAYAAQHLWTARSEGMDDVYQQ